MAKKRALSNEPDHLNSAETGKFLVGKQTRRKITDSNRKRGKTGQISGKKKKTSAVQQTQSCRLTVKLRSHDAEDTAPGPSSTPPFSSASTEKHVVSKIQQQLPVTPPKKARTLEKLAGFPRTSQILQEKGVLMSKGL